MKTRTIIWFDNRISDNCLTSVVSTVYRFDPDGEFWHSSLITKRLHRHVVCSSTGTTYKLVGKIVKPLALAQGVFTVYVLFSIFVDKFLCYCCLSFASDVCENHYCNCFRLFVACSAEVLSRISSWLAFHIGSAWYQVYCCWCLSSFLKCIVVIISNWGRMS